VLAPEFEQDVIGHAAREGAAAEPAVDARERPQDFRKPLGERFQVRRWYGDADSLPSLQHETGREDSGYSSHAGIAHLRGRALCERGQVATRAQSPESLARVPVGEVPENFPGTEGPEKAQHGGRAGPQKPRQVADCLREVLDAVQAGEVREDAVKLRRRAGSLKRSNLLRWQDLELDRGPKRGPGRRVGQPLASYL